MGGKPGFANDLAELADCRPPGRPQDETKCPRPGSVTWAGASYVLAAVI